MYSCHVILGGDPAMSHQKVGSIFLPQKQARPCNHCDQQNVIKVDTQLPQLISYGSEQTYPAKCPSPPRQIPDPQNCEQNEMVALSHPLGLQVVD